MGRFSYRHSGCDVVSDLELPEWRAFARDDASAPEEADIRIALGETLPPADVDSDPAIAADHVRFAIEGAGEWDIAGGSDIAIRPLAAADPAALRLYTLGTAWGVLGYQRGWAMLHASAVMGPRGAVLFCGPERAGKSTIAAAMAERGCPLVSDDLSRVVPGRADRPSAIYPSAVRHKLWSDAVDGLALSAREQSRDLVQEGKFHLPTSRHVALEHPVPLVGIYALRFGEALAIERETGGDAARMLLAETAYRPQIVERMGRLAEQGVYAARIAAGVPIYRLTRPRDLAQVGSVCDAVRAHMEAG